MTEYGSGEHPQSTLPTCRDECRLAVIGLYSILKPAQRALKALILGVMSSKVNLADFIFLFDFVDQAAAD